MDSDNKLLKIYNRQVITPYRIIKNGTIIVRDCIIEAVAEGNLETTETNETDTRGKYIAPGFIDLHIHGNGGQDFMDANEISFLKIAEKHAQFGATSMTPTTLAGDTEELLQLLDLYEQSDKNNNNGSQFFGMHLEGSYFAMSQKSVQNPLNIRNPDPKKYKEIIAHYPFIKRWSDGPELEGSLEFGKFLTSRGIIAAIAHTDTSYVVCKAQVNIIVNKGSFPTVQQASAGENKVNFFDDDLSDDRTCTESFVAMELARFLPEATLIKAGGIKFTDHKILQRDGPVFIIGSRFTNSLIENYDLPEKQGLTKSIICF